MAEKLIFFLLFWLERDEELLDCSGQGAPSPRDQAQKGVSRGPTFRVLEVVPWLLSSCPDLD